MSFFATEGSGFAKITDERKFAKLSAQILLESFAIHGTLFDRFSAFGEFFAVAVPIGQRKLGRAFYLDVGGYDTVKGRFGYMHLHGDLRCGKVQRDILIDCKDIIIAESRHYYLTFFD
jgi:hypothetical protein